MKNYFIALIALAVLVPNAHAATLEITVSPTQAEGKTLTRVVLDTQGALLNTLEGTLSCAGVLEVRDGNSVVNMWVERPLVAASAVRFAGITPGGFRGAGELFTLVLGGLPQGGVRCTLTSANAYLNDGKGTIVPLTLAKVVSTEVLPQDMLDTTAPEAFTIVRGQDASLFDGAPFIAFATQDKQSGIAEYRVAQSFIPAPWFLSWRVAESPYAISTALQWTYVKAIDAMGNERLALLAPGNVFAHYLWITLVVLIVLLGFLRRRA